MTMIHAVIMAGGRGTRFWPMSRSVRAKQFLELIDGKSFLTHTIDRLDGFIPSSQTWIVGNADQADLLKTHKGDVPDQNILLEPCGRNTAPCIAWAAQTILKTDPDAVMIVLPSDHMIAEPNKFHDVLNAAVTEIEQDHSRLITIGIQPSSPHTGYGYIEVEAHHTDELQALQVVAFHEKPDLEMATQYLASGKYFWNAGMFCFRADTILSATASLLPDLAAGLENLNATSPDFKSQYNALPSISIDYGILERSAASMSVIPAPFTWSDVGSWTSLEAFWDKDEDDNASERPLMSINSHGNIVSAEKAVALIDVDDLIVVDTEDALLVAKKSSDQKIKDIVATLPADLS